MTFGIFSQKIYISDIWYMLTENKFSDPTGSINLLYIEGDLIATSDATKFVFSNNFLMLPLNINYKQFNKNHV